MKTTFYKIWTPVFDNNIDALIPEVWAQEALMVLEAQAVGLNFVYRDFEDEIAQAGDIVNAHRPGKFSMKRKWHNDDVVSQDATAENVPVALNQHLYTSFIIRDGEEALSFKRLREMYLIPALSSIVQGVDLMILSQVYKFLGNSVGKLGTPLSKQAVVDVETKFNTLHVPPGARYGLLTPQQKGDLSMVAEFSSAEKIGDNGTAVRTGSLGLLLGTNWVMAQNAPSIAPGNTTYATALTANEAVGSTVLNVTAFTTEHDAHKGGWLTVAGDMTPQKIVNIDASGETITISPGLKYACASTAAVTIYVPGAINLGAGYAAGWLKPITVDGFSVAPQAGQLISVGPIISGSHANWNVDQYSALQASTTELLLDVPLDALKADNGMVGIGPSGNYGLCLHPNAMAFVSRPLPEPITQGAQSFVAKFNDLAIRVVITYDGVKQGHRVTVDMLCGIKVLDTNLGIALLS
jgi:hypothetical protein